MRDEVTEGRSEGVRMEEWREGGSLIVLQLMYVRKK